MLISLFSPFLNYRRFCKIVSLLKFKVVMLIDLIWQVITRRPSFLSRSFSIHFTAAQHFGRICLWNLVYTDRSQTTLRIDAIFLLWSVQNYVLRRSLSICSLCGILQFSISIDPSMIRTLHHPEPIWILHVQEFSPLRQARPCLKFPE